VTLTLPGTTPVSRRRPRASRRRAVFNTALGRAALQALAVIGFFAAWEIGVRMGWISAFLVGSPFGIFADGYKMIISGDLLSDTWYTLFEAILGFVIVSYIALITYVAAQYSAPDIISEFNIAGLIEQPVNVLGHGLFLQAKPLNLDALQLYIALTIGLIPAFWLLMRAPDLTMAGSIVLYLAARWFGFNLSTYPVLQKPVMREALLQAIRSLAEPVTSAA